MHGAWHPDPTPRYVSPRWARGDGLDPLRGPVRKSPTWVVGLVLMGQIVLAPFLLLGMTLGHHPSGFASRSGVTAESGEPRIVNAVCRGERLRSIRLLRRLEEPPKPPAYEPPGWRLLWSMSGDAPLPTTMTLGAAVPGMNTTVPLTELLDPKGAYHVEVTTDELRSHVAFTPRTVPTTGIDAGGDRYADHADFRAAVQEGSPCRRSYEPLIGSTIGAALLLAQLLLFIRGLVMIVNPEYRLLRRHRPGRS